MSPTPWESIRRRTVRAEINPLDKSTIVSIYPIKITEVKPTLQPCKFIIEPGTYENPSVLVIGPSSWWREMGDEEPLLEIPISSIVMADSIVKDFANGMVECNMGDMMPGLFFVPGECTPKDIKEKHRAKLEESHTKQMNWFKGLVQVADMYWSRTNGNPLSISDDMRLAARTLNLDKDWMKNNTTYEKITCKACGTLNNTAVVVCPNCKVVLDPERFKALGLSFAS